MAAKKPAGGKAPRKGPSDGREREPDNAHGYERGDGNGDDRSAEERHVALLHLSSVTSLMPPRNKGKSKAGRPRKVFNMDALNGLLRMQCTLEECVAFFETSELTLRNYIRDETGMTFDDYAASKYATRRVSLKRQMWRTAMGTAPGLERGDTTMQIFLSKQREEKGGLGFSDNRHVKADITVGTPLSRETALGMLHDIHAAVRDEVKDPDILRRLAERFKLIVQTRLMGDEDEAQGQAAVGAG